VLREDVGAVRLHPEREELGQLRVEADAGDLAARRLEHLPVGEREASPVLRAQIGDLEPGVGDDVVVDDDGARVRELRDPVELALVRDLLERRGLILLEVDLLPGDALRQRLECALRRVLRDLGAVEVDDVRHVTRGERREELLVVEATTRVVDVAADRGGREICARVRDLVAGAEAVYLELRRCGERATRGSRARKRRCDDGQTACGDRYEREPLPPNVHSYPPDWNVRPRELRLWERSHTFFARVSRRLPA